MKAEIIAVGTELTTGQNLDTNSQWLSRQLAALGIPVGFHTTVGDDLADNVAVIRTAAGRADLVIITGGLGPTLDDLTRDAMAKVAGVELAFHAPSFDAITALFASRNRPMPERNRVQAMYPAGAEPIPNANGTAPGIRMAIGGCTIIALPGVPREMHAMFTDYVRPLIAPLGVGVQVERRLNTFGAGESHVESLLGDLTARGRDPEVGITASDATIALRIVTRATNESEAMERIAPIERLIRERLGDLVYGTGTEELHDVVIRLLAERGQTIATAESITAGGVAAKLALVPGASEWLRGGVVAYTNVAKVAVLGVPEGVIATHWAVSAEVAGAMAAGAKQLFGTNWAVSTTGLAGPGGGEGKPVGLAFVGVAGPNGVESRRLQWFGSRDEVQRRTAKSALDEIRRKISVAQITD